MPEQQKKHEFPIIPFMLLGVLIINSAVLAYKYINFYYFKDILADIHSLACTTDCDAVMLSKYALLFGIPTPIFGLASFSLLCYMFSRIHFGNEHPDLKTKIDNELEKIQRVFETFLIFLILIALSYMYIMFFKLELVCKFCMLSHVTLFLFAAYYFVYYKRFSVK
jgi:uncharacterized membrane protein